MSSYNSAGRAWICSYVNTGPSRQTYLLPMLQQPHRPIPQNPGIGGPEKTPLRRFGMMYFVGYKVSPMLQQRRFLIVSNVNTPDFFLMVSSGHSSVASENGDRSWQGMQKLKLWTLSAYYRVEVYVFHRGTFSIGDKSQTQIFAVRPHGGVFQG